MVKYEITFDDVEDEALSFLVAKANAIVTGKNASLPDDQKIPLYDNTSYLLEVMQGVKSSWKTEYLTMFWAKVQEKFVAVPVEYQKLIVDAVEGKVDIKLTNGQVSAL